MRFCVFFTLSLILGLNPHILKAQSASSNLAQLIQAPLTALG